MFSQRATEAMLRRVLAKIGEEPARLEGVLADHAEPLIAFTADRRILAANASAESFFGRAPHGLDSRSTDELLPARLRQPNAPAMVPNEELMSVELLGLRSDGTEASLAWTFGSVPASPAPVFVLTFRDRAAIDDALDALAASEERFHHLINAVTDYAIFMLDAEGRVATWNEGARKAKGYEAGEIVGQPFSLFYTSEDRAEGKPARVLETVRREGRFEEEGWRVRKDGSRFLANVVITALRDQGGDVTGFAKVTRDLTDRRLAEANERALAREQLARAAYEEERRRLLTLLEQVPAVVNFFRGPELVFEFAHPKAREAMGNRDVVGKPLLVALPEERWRPYAAQLRRVYETGEPWVQHESLVSREVEGRVVETYWDSVYLPVRDVSGAIEGVMTFEVDVTSSVTSRQALEAAGRAKDEFLATVSHELRTPLHAMLGWATILRRKARDAETLERGLEVIQRNARAQERLVSDLLDISRIISGKLVLSMRRTEIRALIDAAVEVVRPAAESKRVQLVVEVDPEIGVTIGDHDRLQQVLWNLLINATRFTPSGGRVCVRADRTGGEVHIRVADTGIGISSEDLPHVFNRFWQVERSTTRSHGGLGLGLSIVRHLVEAHGGSVRVQSGGLGKGASFTLTLPIVAANTLSSPPEAIPPAGASLEHAGLPDRGEPATLARVRVLLVEDDRDSLGMLRAALEDAGATVCATASAREALEARGPFDIIVSDIGMPEMDGYSFIRRVRARDVGADIPAIALTAYARADDAERAVRAGYQEHVAKPVDPGSLVETIRTWTRPASRAPE